MLYEAILIGDFVADPQSEGDGIKTRGSGLQDTKLFFPYFVSQEEAPASVLETDKLANPDAGAGEVTPPGR